MSKDLTRKSITEGKTLREYQQAYGKLNADQKNYLWKDKLENSKRFFNNSEQVNYLDFLSNSLSANTFEIGFSNIETDLLFEKSRKLFTEIEILHLMMILHGILRLVFLGLYTLSNSPATR